MRVKEDACLRGEGVCHKGGWEGTMQGTEGIGTGVYEGGNVLKKAGAGSVSCPPARILGRTGRDQRLKGRLLVKTRGA